MKTMLRFLVVMLAGGFTTNAQAQMDANGDGVADPLAFIPCDDLWIVRDGALPDKDLSVLFGDQQGEFFTSVGVMVPDMTGDALPEVAIIASLFKDVGTNAGGDPNQNDGPIVGRVYLMEAGSGLPVWTYSPIAPLMTLPGLASVPDQDLDGTPDLLVRAVDTTQPRLDLTILLSGRDGAELSVLTGPMLEYADKARDGALLLAKADLNQSGSIDAADLQVFAALQPANDPQSDLTGDGVSDQDDLDVLLALQGAPVVRTPDKLAGVVFDPVTLERSIVTMTEAESLLDDDPGVHGTSDILTIGNTFTPGMDIPVTPEQGETCEDDLVYVIVAGMLEQ
ncbi:MAG: hypothetical protein AAGG07_09435 [Planctomycetota bacterium]